MPEAFRVFGKHTGTGPLLKVVFTVANESKSSLLFSIIPKSSKNKIIG